MNQRCSVISICFPEFSQFQKEDNQKVLELINSAEIQTSKSNIENKDLFPKIAFEVSSALEFPQISFNYFDKKDEKNFQEENFLRWNANNLDFGFNLDHSKSVKPTNSSSDINYSKARKEHISPVTLDILLKKLTGKLKSLNHAGINFSPVFISKNEYREIKRMISESTNLYNYPTGEEWPFIIPSTKEEFENEITDFSIARNPKFELVYSNYNYNPVIQLDFDTTLTKKEAFELFPSPFGISYPGLENAFRTVFVKMHWGNVLLRFDISFRGDGEDFGYWMIREGKRVGLE